MIKLIKLSEPNILITNKREWTRELLDYIQRGEKVPDGVSTKYNCTEVKDNLRIECHSKCMYCESTVEHIADLNIEHYKPKHKDKYPELCFEYNNLGLACTVCNRNKSYTFDEALCFINPYEDNPENHFQAVGMLVVAKPGDDRAKLTENELELNRPELLEARHERFKTIRSMIDDYAKSTNPTLRESIMKQIIKEIDETKVYSFCMKKYVKSVNLVA